MSDNVRSYGFIAVLMNRNEVPDLDELNEKLWEAQSAISVNYEGTLVFSDLSRKKSYSERSDIYGFQIGGFDQMDHEAFKTECEKHGLSIDTTTIKPYHCIWYNGSDSPMDQLKKEDFLKK